MGSESQLTLRDDRHVGGGSLTVQPGSQLAVAGPTRSKETWRRQFSRVSHEHVGHRLRDQLTGMRCSDPLELDGFPYACRDVSRSNRDFRDRFGIEGLRP